MVGGEFAVDSYFRMDNGQLTIFCRTEQMYCRGGNLAARHVSITTCSVEWYDPIYGTNVAAMIHRHSSPARGWTRNEHNLCG